MHRRATLPLLLAAFGLCFTQAHPASAAVSNGFRVPDGFEVSLYAGDDLAHDIFSMTTDAKGRIVVAGKDYVKVLHDTKGTGKADKATLFVKASKTGAHGMYFEGNDLIMNGDGGVRRWHDTDGDGVADGEPEFWLRTERDGEHSANGIVKGPDGWFYLICGNDTGISSEHAKLPGSPIKQVNAGALVRISPDGKTSEVLAHGFRNPYDIDFHPFGNVFTYDADGERDHHLPWYSGTRIFDIAIGAHHGWVLKGWGHAWNRPPAWPDNTERLWEVGRGSPTGVFVYRHRAFPERYRNGFFALCWTYGRLYYFPLTRRGSTFDTKMEIFMETAGDTGFAPVDAVVGPDGDVFVAIGGRGTIGSVFRVHYTGKLPVEKPVTDPVRQVLTAPQPLASWSRAKWVPTASLLGAKVFEEAAANSRLSVLERIRALEVLVELFGGVSPEVGKKVEKAKKPELTARTVWAVSRGPDQEARRLYLIDKTFDDDPRVARASWEALLALPSPIVNTVLTPNQRGGYDLPHSVDYGASRRLFAPNWQGGFDSPDRRVRAAAAAVASGVGQASYRQAGSLRCRRYSHRELITAWLASQVAVGITNHSKATADSRQFEMAWFGGMWDKETDKQTSIDAVRYLQRYMGDVKLQQDKPDTYDGFVANNPERIPEETRIEFAKQISRYYFPTGHHDLDREMGRLLAMLSADAPGLLERVMSKVSDTSPVEDDIHYLMVAARLPSPRNTENTARIAEAVVGLHHKMRADKKEPSTFWPVRVANLFSRLLERDPQLAAALIASPNFNLADHALFAQRLDSKDKPAAARRLLAATEWTGELVAFLEALPDAELFPALRQQWSNARLQDAITRLLARAPQPEDRVRLVAALGSFQPAVVEVAAKSLAQLGGEATPKELAAALASLRRQCTAPKEKAARTALVDLLAKWSGQAIAVTEAAELGKSYTPWFAWFAQAHPATAKELLGESEDTEAFLKRLPAVAWDSGDVQRGQRLYEERLCHRCHSSSTRIGPDLTGVASRLSREDLFIAILDPSRDISPAYVPKLLTTKSGATYSGFLVYDSPTAKLVQTGPDTTVRLTGDEVTSVVDSRVSLMPVGLLAGLKDGDVADFYAFLKTLKK